MTGRAQTRKWWHKGVQVVGLVLVLVAGGWALAPRGVPVLPPTSVWNVIFGSAWVVGVVRLAGVAAVLYVVASICVRAWHEEWLRRLGPADAQVESKVEDVAGDRQKLRDELDRSRDLIADLLIELEETTDLLDDALAGGRPAREYRDVPQARDDAPQEGDDDDSAAGERA